MQAASHLLRRLEASGIAAADILDNWRKPCFQAMGDDISFEILELYDLLNFVARSTRPGIGFEIGNHWLAEDYDPYGSALQNCANLTEASSVFKRLQTSRRQPHFFSDTTTCKEWLIEFAPSAPFGPGATIVIEDLLARTKKEISQYLGQKVVFNRIELAYRAPDHKSLYADVFECPVLFGRPKTVAAMSIDYLHHPLNGASPYGAPRPDRGKEIYGQFDLHERVMLAILETLVLHPGAYPGMQQIADMFATSISTLKRLLSREGANYRALVDVVRREHVAEYLALTSLSPKEIAYRLGFTNVNNFRRAFARWMAMTPNQYRDRVRQALPLVH